MKKPRAKFDNEAKSAIGCSREVALELKNNFIAIEHLFLGMLNTPDAKFLAHLDFNWEELKRDLYVLLQKKYPPQEMNWGNELHLTHSAENILVLAVMECRLSLRQTITTQDLFLGILTNRNLVTKLLSDRGINYKTVYKTYITSPTRSPNRIVYRYPLATSDLLSYKLRRFYCRYIKQ